MKKYGILEMFLMQLEDNQEYENAKALLRSFTSLFKLPRFNTIEDRRGLIRELINFLSQTKYYGHPLFSKYPFRAAGDCFRANPEGIEEELLELTVLMKQNFHLMNPKSQARFMIAYQGLDLGQFEDIELELISTEKIKQFLLNLQERQLNGALVGEYA